MTSHKTNSETSGKQSNILICIICINSLDAIFSIDSQDTPHYKSLMDIDAINYKNLSTVTAISAGFPLRGAVDALEDGDTAVVQMRNVNAATGVNWNTTSKVTLPTKRKPDWLQNGDVIFAARGAKNYAVALENVPYAAVCSPHFFILRIKNGCDPAFLAWQINQKPAQEYFKRSATGSYILNIRREVIENLKIALPSLDQQRMIVQHFQAATAEHHALEELIENRNREIEAIALGLFQNKLKG